MQISVAALRGAVQQQQRAAVYAALLPSLNTNFTCHAARRNALTTARGRVRGAVAI